MQKKSILVSVIAAELLTAAIANAFIGGPAAANEGAGIFALEGGLMLRGYRF